MPKRGLTGKYVLNKNKKMNLYYRSDNSKETPVDTLNRKYKTQRAAGMALRTGLEAKIAKKKAEMMKGFAKTGRSIRNMARAGGMTK